MNLALIAGSKWFLRNDIRTWSLLRFDDSGSFQEIHMHRKSVFVLSGPYEAEEDVLTLSTYWQSTWNLSSSDLAVLDKRIDHRQAPIASRFRIVRLDGEVLETSEFSYIKEGEWTAPTTRALTYTKLPEGALL